MLRGEDWFWIRHILSDNKSSGLNPIGLLIWICIFGAIIEWLIDQVPKWFNAFYLWTEPFRTLFFQDFFFSLSIYLLPIGVIYTIVHIICEDYYLQNVCIYSLIAGVITGICRILFRISTGNWASMPDTDNIWLTVFVWFPVGCVYYLALGALILFGAFTVMSFLYLGFCILLNGIATAIAQIRYDKYYNRLYASYIRKYRTPSKADSVEMRMFEDALNESFAHFHEPEYDPPVIYNAHEKLYLAVIYPICLFFVVWFALCLGGCVYLLI